MMRGIQTVVWQRDQRGERKEKSVFVWPTFGLLSLHAIVVNNCMLDNLQNKPSFGAS